MKKSLRAFLLSISCCASLFGAANKLSDIEPAREFYVDLEPKACDTKCLLTLLKKGQIFSFLSRFRENLANDELSMKYRDFLAGNFGSFASSSTPSFVPTSSAAKIAVLIPQKTIKSYSVIVSNSIIAYSAAAKNKALVQFFLFDDESNIGSVLENVLAQGFNYAIAPITDAALEQIADERYKGIFFYVPTLHASLARYERPNILFGGVDYDGQIRSLSQKTDGKIASISDGSRLGSMLNRQVALQNPDAFLSVIETKNVDLRGEIRRSGFMGASVFLNTTLLKTSLISSQFRVYDVNVKKVLCTQICYDPALFSLTQPSDRANMLIAISFSDIDENLLANAKLLGVDLKYDRVAYPVMFGMDYIITNFIDKNAHSFFMESVSGSQVQYKTQILQPTKSGFEIVE